MTSPSASTFDQRNLAAALVPSLQQACEDRLGDVNWFRADWQRGGAATGHTSFTIARDDLQPAVVKLPVAQRELRWIRRINESRDEPLIGPRLFASGDSLGGYDLAWVVMERFPHGPLGLRWSEDHIPRIADAAARFHRIALSYPVSEPPRDEDWGELVDGALESVRVNRLPGDDRWIRLLKALRDRLDGFVTEWRARDVRQWLHGDLHLANAMSRTSLDAGPVCLIDFAEVHSGHWLEDAVYLERQLWARPERMKNHKPVKVLAEARRRNGLPVENNYARLAMIRRALLAATAPRFLRTEGHPAHLEACLDWLERALDELR